MFRARRCLASILDCVLIMTTKTLASAAPPRALLVRLGLHEAREVWVARARAHGTQADLVLAVLGVGEAREAVVARRTCARLARRVRAELHLHSLLPPTTFTERRIKFFSSACVPQQRERKHESVFLSVCVACEIQKKERVLREKNCGQPRLARFYLQETCAGVVCVCMCVCVGVPRRCRA